MPEGTRSTHTKRLGLRYQLARKHRSRLTEAPAPKRTHCKLIGMGYWGYYYAALHVAPDGPVLFYVQQTPCVNKHGVPIDDWYVVGNGGTSATGPIKKL